MKYIFLVLVLLLTSCTVVDRRTVNIIVIDLGQINQYDQANNRIHTSHIGIVDNVKVKKLNQLPNANAYFIITDGKRDGKICIGDMQSVFMLENCVKYKEPLHLHILDNLHRRENHV